MSIRFAASFLAPLPPFTDGLVDAVAASPSGDSRRGVSTDPSFVAPARHDRGPSPLAASFPPSGTTGVRDHAACELPFVLMRDGDRAGTVSRADFE